MRLHIVSIGRWSGGPDKVLYEHYADRIDRLARNLALGPLALREVVPKKTSDRDEEATALLKATPQNSFVIALDETGKTQKSSEFADFLASKRDDGTSDMAFVVGGAEGLGATVTQGCQLKLSLGAMTWPHMLVRVMLAEQVYRALTILAGHPYHKA